MINFRKFNVETNGRTSGRMKTYCPQCHASRRDKRDKSLSVNLDTGLAYCHHCNWKINAREEQKMPHEKTYVTPRQPAVLADEIVRWFAQQRGIPAGVLIQAGISSAEEYMPQTRKKELCACFNYYEGNRLVNTKFRDMAKNFKFVAGAELIPYNVDGILGTEECIITEGEIDALSFMAIGRNDVISVPGGANRNLSWMDRFVTSHFEDKRTVYICTDTDRKGQELREELVRRLGAERCRIVDLAPAKDANQLLLEPHGKEALKAALENAPQAPLEGVYTGRRPERRTSHALRKRIGIRRRHGMGELGQTLHLRTRAPLRRDRNARKREVRICGRTGAAPLPAPPLASGLLQPGKHALGLPPAEIGRKAGGHPVQQARHARKPVPRHCPLFAGEHHVHPAQRRFHGKKHPGQSPRIGAPSRHTPVCARSPELR
jgi:twinkle protein